MEEGREGEEERGGNEAMSSEEELKERRRRWRTRREGSLRSMKEVEAARATLVLILRMSGNVFVDFLQFLGREGGMEVERE